MILFILFYTDRDCNFIAYYKDIFIFNIDNKFFSNNIVFLTNKFTYSWLTKYILHQI